MAFKFPSSLFKDGASLWLVVTITERLMVDMEFLKSCSQAFKKQSEDTDGYVRQRKREVDFLMVLH